MVVSMEQDQEDLGTVWQSWGGKWSTHDSIHFEYPGFHPTPSGESLLYKVATTAAGIALPLKLSLALSLGEWISENPRLATAVEQLQVLGLPVGSYLDRSLEEVLRVFPQWALDILGL
jgi:hypothetical protein